MGRPLPKPVPVPLSYEPTAADVRQLFHNVLDRKGKLPNPTTCQEVADALGLLGRHLRHQLVPKNKAEALAVEQRRAFWEAMRLLDFAMEGLHPLYGLTRIHLPGQTEPVDGHTAFERLMGAMHSASRYVVQEHDEQRPAFDVPAYADRLLALFRHAMSIANPKTEFGTSPSGPAMRFVSRALTLVSGVEMSPGALRQHIKE